MTATIYSVPQPCNGMDVFFSKKPNISLGQFIKLFKVYNAAVMQNVDTSDDVAASSLSKAMNIIHGKKGSVYCITCKWPSTTNVVPLDVLQRTRDAFGELEGYEGSELYIEMSAEQFNNLAA